MSPFAQMRLLTRWGCYLALLLCLPDGARAEGDSFDDLASEYTDDVHPLLVEFCLDCHAGNEPEGDLDLSGFLSLREVRAAPRVWQKVDAQLEAEEMPPSDEQQPTPEQRRLFREWVVRYLRTEAFANAGDPGPVGLRRLNNAEYTYTIRDLTGVDLNPAREFPVDSAAGEGFTNASNALAMSPALFPKYLDAGKEIAAHVILLPDGFRFSRYRTQSDWIDELLSQIRAFYRQRVEIVDLGLGTSVGVMNLHGDCRLGQLGQVPVKPYFAALVEDHHALLRGQTTISEVAREHQVNTKYLGSLWEMLNSDLPSLLLDDLRRQWRGAGSQDVQALEQQVADWQRGLWTFNPISLMGRTGSRSSWMEPVDPIVTRQELRLRFPLPSEGQEPEDVVVSLVATDAGDGSDHDVVIWSEPRLVAANQPDLLLRDIDSLQGIDHAAFGHHPEGGAIDSASLCVHAPQALTLRIPGTVAAGREMLVEVELDSELGHEGSVQVDLVTGVTEATPGLRPSVVTCTLSTVTNLFADERTVTYQHPVLIAPDSPRHRELIGAFAAHRELFPPSFCYPQVVPADEVLTLTQFHREDEPLVRLLLDDQDKRELDRLWMELRYVAQEPLKLSAVLDSLVETLRGQSQQGAMDALIEPFHQRASEFRQLQLDVEAVQLNALIDFAKRAYRRPLEPPEADELRSLYTQLRAEDLTHEEAFRLTLARVFVAAPFLYRLEIVPSAQESAPVSDWELATRLSYFLWSSMPDDELRGVVADGELRAPDVLERQTLRLLNDSKVRRLATEFVCQWLHVYEFPVTERKSEQVFPEFDALRADMYEETILFFTDLFQSDATLQSVLTADHTFVNRRLAQFYELDVFEGDGGWQRVDGLRQQGRGGILGLSSVLAKQSGASRTSPILRGNWISEVLLGEKLPRPPKDVPQLADTVPAGLSERELIERHSRDAACAKCHQRIDPFGFALEGFDAIGRMRTTDLAGKPINTQTTLADGERVDGLKGLREYLTTTRRDAFVRQFCRKLLGYALGRETQLSDEPLLESLQETLTAEDGRISQAILAIVQSRQFQELRGDSPKTEEVP